MAKINDNYLSRASIVPTRETPIRPLQVSPIPQSGASLRGSRIATPRARNTIVARPQLSPAPLITPGDVTNIANVIQEKTLKMQEEENNLIARERVIQVKDQLRELGYGEQGYFHTQGKEAVVGREVVQVKANEIIQAAFEGLDPAVQEKLVAPLLAEKEAFVNQAARYSATQRRTWENDVQAANANQFDRELAILVSNEEEAHRAVLHKAHELFPDFSTGEVNPVNADRRLAFIEEASVKQIAMLLDTPGGVDAASERFEFLKERVGFETQQKMINVLESGIDRYNKRVLEEERRYTKAIDERKLRIQDSLSKEVFEGRPPISKARLVELVEAGDIGIKWAIKYEKTYIDNEKDDDNKELILEMEDLILENPNGNLEDGTSLINFIEDHPDVSLVEARRLRKLQKDVLEKGFTEDFKRGKEQIKILTTPDAILKGFFKRDSEQQRFFANRELEEGLKAGKPLSEIMTTITDKYSSQGLPPAYGGLRPQDAVSLQAIADKILQDKESGTLTDSEAQVQFDILRVHMRQMRQVSNGR